MTANPFDDQRAEIERYELRESPPYAFEADRREPADFARVVGARSEIVNTASIDGFDFGSGSHRESSRDPERYVPAGVSPRILNVDTRHHRSSIKSYKSPKPRHGVAIVVRYADDGWVPSFGAKP